MSRFSSTAAAKARCDSKICTSEKSNEGIKEGRILRSAVARQPDFYALEVRPSRIDGRGLYTRVGISARRKIGELSGERISEREARRRARGRERIAIVETGDRMATDASQGGNEWKFINHSCAPNAFMRICRGRVEFYALRDIRPGEELTCDYHESHHRGKRPCTCGSSRCQGYI